MNLTTTSSLQAINLFNENSLTISKAETNTVPFEKKLATIDYLKQEKFKVENIPAQTSIESTKSSIISHFNSQSKNREGNFSIGIDTQYFGGIERSIPPAPAHYQTPIESLSILHPEAYPDSDMDDTASVATAKLLEGFSGDQNISDIESEAHGIFEEQTFNLQKCCSHFHYNLKVYFD